MALPSGGRLSPGPRRRDGRETGPGATKPGGEKRSERAGERGPRQAPAAPCGLPLAAPGSALRFSVCCAPPSPLGRRLHAPCPPLRAASRALTEGLRCPCGSPPRPSRPPLSACQRGRPRRRSALPPRGSRSAHRGSPAQHPFQRLLLRSACPGTSLPPLSPRVCLPVPRVCAFRPPPAARLSPLLSHLLPLISSAGAPSSRFTVLRSAALDCAQATSRLSRSVFWKAERRQASLIRSDYSIILLLCVFHCPLQTFAVIFRI